MTPEQKEEIIRTVETWILDGIFYYVLPIIAIFAFGVYVGRIFS